MSETANRLMRYAAVAAALPAAGAQAGIVANPNLDLVINPGESALIDFGPGFGEVFRFELRNYRSSDRAVSTSYYNALFQFNSTNSGGVQTAGFVAHQTLSARSTANDPQRLGFGSVISIERVFYDPMSNNFGSAHDIAFQSNSGNTSARDGIFGSWVPDSRGYIGFKMFQDGSYHFGWFDVETLGWASPERSAVPQLIIHGWGFNDEFRLPIDAGDTPAPAAGGLLALALGAAGVRRARREA